MCVITIYAKVFQTKGLNNLKPSIVKIYIPYPVMTTGFLKHSHLVSPSVRNVNIKIPNLTSTS